MTIYSSVAKLSQGKIVTKIVIVLAVVWALSACTAVPVSRDPPMKLEYEGQTRAQSGQKATIHLETEYVSGRMSGPEGKNRWMLAERNPALIPDWQFNQGNQLDFVVDLAKELNRLGLLNVTAAGVNLPEGKPATIWLRFLRAHLDPIAPAYRLDVLAEFRGPGGEMSSFYLVELSDELWYGSILDRKRFLAQQLLNAIIPDVEKWLLASSAPE